MKIQLRELQDGDFFRINNFDLNKPVSESSVWICGKFDRSTKRYSCVKFSNSNHKNFFKGDRIVYVGFDF